MGLWVCGFMGLWACGFMGLWAYGFMGLWVYGFMGLWVYGLMCLSAYGFRGTLHVNRRSSELTPALPRPPGVFFWWVSQQGSQPLPSCGAGDRGPKP